MKLKEFLEGYITMKQLFGENWTYWERNSNSVSESYIIETPEKIEITLVKVLKFEDSHNVGVVIYFPLASSVQCENFLKWKHEINVSNYSSKNIKTRDHIDARKVIFTVNGFETCRDMLDKVFQKKEIC